MMQLVLWPIFAIWMLTGLVVAAVILGMLVWGIGHQLKDERGEDGDLWCPVMKRDMHVHGVPRRFLIGPEFIDVSRCEQWGKGQVRCSKACVHAELSASKAA